jgi:hypothetical protein
VTDFDALIDALADELRPLAQRDPNGWQRVAVEEVLPRRLREAGTAEEFFRWAQHHRLWSFTVAECVERVCAKPGELAIEVLRAILEERLEVG